MLSWKERIGNEIEMTIPSDDGISQHKVRGTVYAGYRYMDGVVSMHGYDGKDYSAGVESWTISKTENTQPDLLTNYDYIKSLDQSQLATWLTNLLHEQFPITSENSWNEWLDQEHIDNSSNI